MYQPNKERFYSFKYFHSQQRIVAKCLENRIALYSPHTSFDSIYGGVNDWLAAAFKVKESNPIQPDKDPQNGMGRLCVLNDEITILQAVELVKKHTKLKYVRLAQAKNSSKLISQNESFLFFSYQ